MELGVGEGGGGSDLDSHGQDNLKRVKILGLWHENLLKGGCVKYANVVIYFAVM